MRPPQVRIHEGKLVKSIVWFFGIAGAGLVFSTGEARAQRSGSLQATAQVVDAGESWTALNSASQLASRWPGGRFESRTIETSLSQIYVVVEPGRDPARPEAADLAESFSITIQYLRN